MPTQNFNVNGQSVSVDAPPEMALLWVLREHLKMARALSA